MGDGRSYSFISRLVLHMWKVGSSNPSQVKPMTYTNLYLLLTSLHSALIEMGNGQYQDNVMVVAAWSPSRHECTLLQVGTHPHSYVSRM